jgi:hypothetical protein
MPNDGRFLSAADISVPAPVMAARIDMILHAELSSYGFERVRPRHWVDSTLAPIRRIFEFQPLKGDSYSARWGFSLDFVPRLKNGKLAWKRTTKTACFDLRFDPIDQEPGRVEWCRFSRFILPYKIYDWSKVTRAVVNGAKAARSDFKRVRSVRDIVETFREKSVMKFYRFSLENYIQTHIAWGLCLISIGERDEAEDHLQKFCLQFSVDRNDRILRAAEDTARTLRNDNSQAATGAVAL